MKVLYILSVILVIVMVGCSNESVIVNDVPLEQKSLPKADPDMDVPEGGEPVEEDIPSAPPTDEPMNLPASFSMEEIAKHGSENDCWLLIDGKVYDVTEFIGRHPGGDAVLEGCGIDSTELYETRPMGSGTPHSPGARQRLDDYYIGELK